MVREHPELARRHRPAARPQADLHQRLARACRAGGGQARRAAVLRGHLRHLRLPTTCPSPTASCYDHFCRAHGVDAAASAMFEDMPHNLEAPHALGMTTVLVRSEANYDHPVQQTIRAWIEPPEHVHHMTDDLDPLPRRRAPSRAALICRSQSRHPPTSFPRRRGPVTVPRRCRSPHHDTSRCSLRRCNLGAHLAGMTTCWSVRPPTTTVPCGGTPRLTSPPDTCARDRRPHPLPRRRTRLSRSRGSSEGTTARAPPRSRRHFPTPAQSEALRLPGGTLRSSITVNRVALGINDQERALRTLRGVKEKRLTYRTTGGARRPAGNESEPPF